MSERIDNPREISIKYATAQRVVFEAADDRDKFIRKALHNLQHSNKDFYILCRDVAAALSRGPYEVDDDKRRGDSFLIGALVGSELIRRQFPEETSHRYINKAIMGSASSLILGADTAGLSKEELDHIVYNGQDFCQAKLSSIYPLIESTENNVLGNDHLLFFPQYRAGVGFVAEPSLQAIGDAHIDTIVEQSAADLDLLNDSDAFSQLFGPDNR